MKIQAKDIQSGMTFTAFGVTYVAESTNTLNETVFVTVESTNPFVSSSFCAFNSKDMIEVSK